MEPMEASSHVLCSSHRPFHYQSKSKPSLSLVRPSFKLITPPSKLGMNSGRLSMKVDSAKWGSSAPSLGGKLKANVEEGGEEIHEEFKEIRELVSEKCREKKDVVELLECLEKEAIMGDDMGKEPHDYNRRAIIFDKSSKVFKALMEREAAAYKL